MSPITRATSHACSRGCGWTPQALDPQGHPARRGRHRTLALRGLARTGGAGRERAPRAGFRGRIRVLSPSRGGQDLRTRGADAGPPGEADARPTWSVMGGMTPEGKLYTLVRQESLNGWHSIEFLVHLGRVAGKRLLVIWDGSPIHRRSEVTQFGSRTRARSRVETLPGYAPDLNPWDEGGWNHLKNVEMRNPRVSRPRGVARAVPLLAIGRLRHKPPFDPSLLCSGRTEDRN